MNIVYTASRQQHIATHNLDVAVDSSNLYCYGQVAKPRMAPKRARLQSVQHQERVAQIKVMKDAAHKELKTMRKQLKQEPCHIVLCIIEVVFQSVSFCHI
jgi:hypothetical protein